MKERLLALREYMKKEGVGACVIPTSDPHMSEYLCNHFKTREFFCPFTGSAGTLVVTESKSLLWTDGRYFIQAEKELSGSETRLMRFGEKETPTVEEFLCTELKKGECAALDGRLFSFNRLEKMRRKLCENGIDLKYDFDPAVLWHGRPDMPREKAFLLNDGGAGADVKDKLCAIAERIEENGADYFLISSADGVCWTLNIRCGDVYCTPVMLSFLLVSKDGALLFANGEKLLDTKKYLCKNNVTQKDYDSVYSVVSSLPEEARVICDFEKTNYMLVKSLGKRAVNHSDFAEEMKCVKSSAELENIKRAYILENTALIKTFYNIYESGTIKTETDVCREIEKNRAAAKEYMYPSFETIAAYGKNAAMMHYSPIEETAAKIQKRGMLLIDTGGQYAIGTTDTTRTLILGDITPQQAENYTLVLKGNINLARTVFKEGCSGRDIDIAARRFLWEKGLDYRCGTGHGVGYVLCVHEGPQRISKGGNYVLKEGTTVTDEPGVYIENEYGIRIETHLCIVKKCETEYGKFLEFQNLSYCPIGTKGIAAELLTPDEKEYLNRYNEKCRQMYKKYLTAEEYLWLENYTARI